ncbi:hypothetical protein BJY04DRAFT_186770 [Aspergillus karnatakaensis]|uniref:uncharacterized protein n=1 Tax=Aspergillus karnatakaensis TaxID=1810916 RepID=UPI003CCE182E
MTSQLTVSLMLSLLAISAAGDGGDCEISPTITSQGDADTIFDKCPEVEGTIMLNLSATHEGLLVLPNLTRLDGRIRADGFSSPTSIEAPELVYMSSLIITDTAGMLSRLSFPRLEDSGDEISLDTTSTSLEFPVLKKAGYIALKGAPPQNNSGQNDPTTQSLEVRDSPTADFSSLVTAESVRLEGPFARLDMGSLESISKTLTIDTEADVSSEVSFPSLKSAFAIVLSDNISNISLPELMSVRESDDAVYVYHSETEPKGVHLVLNASTIPLSLYLPRLRSVSNFMINGPFQKIHLPSLEANLGPIYINSTRPLSLTAGFYSIHTSIGLCGAIHSVSFPNLTDSKRISHSITINSTIDFDCPAFGSKIGKFVFCSSPSSSYDHYDALNQKAAQRKLDLARLKKVLLGIFIPLGAFGVLVYYLFTRKKGGSQQRSAVTGSRTGDSGDLTGGLLRRWDRRLTRRGYAPLPDFLRSDSQGSRQPLEMDDMPPPPYSPRQDTVVGTPTQPGASSGRIET